MALDDILFEDEKNLNITIKIPRHYWKFDVPLWEYDGAPEPTQIHKDDAIYVGQDIFKIFRFAIKQMFVERDSANCCRWFAIIGFLQFEFAKYVGEIVYGKIDRNMYSYFFRYRYIDTRFITWNLMNLKVTMENDDVVTTFDAQLYDAWDVVKKVNVYEANYINIPEEVKNKLNLSVDQLIRAYIKVDPTQLYPFID